jgi:hypothetical protein
MRIQHTAFLAAWALVAGTAAAQTLSFSAPQDLELIPHRGYSEHVRVASNGRTFALVWRTKSEKTAAAIVDANGKLGARQLLSEEGSDPVVASGGGGYLAAWKYKDDSIATTPVNTAGRWEGFSYFPFAGVDGTTLRLGATDTGYLLAWRTSGTDRKTLYAVFLDRRGWRRGKHFAISDDVVSGSAAITRAGAGYLVAYATSRGIETADVDERAGIAARQLVADGVFTEPLAATTAAGPAIVFSRAGRTWALLLTQTGAATEAEELVADGAPLHAVGTNSSPLLIVVRQANGRVRLFQVRRLRRVEEVSGIPPHFLVSESIAHGGSKLLFARSQWQSDFTIGDLEGVVAEPAPFAFASIIQSPTHAATAGGTDLALWHEFNEHEWRGDFAGRFRNGVALDGMGLSDIDYRAVATDGTSVFLVAGTPHFSQSATFVRIMPVDGKPSALIPIGAGTPVGVVWDGREFVVFREETISKPVMSGCETTSTLYATRVRVEDMAATRGEDIVLADGGAEEVSWSFDAAVTSAGFVIARTVGQGVRVSAFTYGLTLIRITDLPLPEPNEGVYAYSLAGDGADRVAIGVLVSDGTPFSKRLDRTFVVNAQGELEWVARNFTRSMIWNDGALALFFFVNQTGKHEAVLWKGGDEPADARLASTPVVVDFAQTEPSLATASGRTIAVYNRPIDDPLDQWSFHLVLRTLRVLPKGEPQP